jgi:tRNA G26 N,N-dimethylase Trm1
MMGNAGPLWLGSLWDEQVAHKIAAQRPDDKSLQVFINTISEEAKIPVVGFIDLPTIGKKLKIGNLPSRDKLLQWIRQSGHKASLTHLTSQGYRTTMSIDGIETLLGKNK